MSSDAPPSYTTTSIVNDVELHNIVLRNDINKLMKRIDKLEKYINKLEEERNDDCCSPKYKIKKSTKTSWGSYDYSDDEKYG